MNTPWKAILWRQFGAAIDMFENALHACPEDLWTVELWNDLSQPPAFSQFWYVAYHTLFWLDLYLSGSVEGFAPPEPFTLDELDPAGVLPGRQYAKAELLAYLHHCRQKCRATLHALSDDRAQQACQFPWGELSFAELLLDNLRHVQEHAAQLNLVLGQYGIPSRWVAQAKQPAHIRRATPGDSPALARLQVDSYRSAYAGLLPAAYLAGFSYQEQAQDWRGWLASHPADVLLVAEAASGELVGYALGRVGPSAIPPYDSELLALHVSPTHQGQGIGRALVADIANQLRLKGCASLLLWVLEHNPARRFYEHLGGQVVGQQMVSLGEGIERVEIAYGWLDIRSLCACAVA